MYVTVFFILLGIVFLDRLCEKAIRIEVVVDELRRVNDLCEDDKIELRVALGRRNFWYGFAGISQKNRAHAVLRRTPNVFTLMS